MTMKNHYIPCFYTKRWAAADRRLVQFSRPSTLLVDRRKFPTQVGYSIDLYTLPGTEDSTKYILEKEFFCAVDQLASDVLFKMETGGTPALNEQDRLAWIAFLISLRQRNPQRLLEFAQQAEGIFQQQIEGYKREYYLRREVDDKKSFEEFIDDMKRDKWFERTNKLLLRKVVFLPQTTEAIRSFAWEVLMFSSPEHELLTSDRPVLMTDGLDHVEGHIALPIGPRKLFIAARDKKTMRDIVNTPGLVSTANDIVVRQAYAEVYGRDLTQKAFVDARLCRGVRKSAATLAA